MQFKKIASQYRIECTAGNTTTVALPATPGGRFIKSLNYMIEILATSSTSARISLTLNHGPTGQTSVQHTAVIPMTTLTAGTILLSGDASSSSVIGEYLHPIVAVTSNVGAAEWVLFNLYEMRKPF